LIQLLLAFTLALPAFSQQDAGESVFPLPPFTEGMTTRYSANAIPDGALTDATNVVLDEDIPGIPVNRLGYAKYNTTAIPNSKSVRGLWPFDATDGTHYIVAMSSSAFYKSSGDGTWTAISGLSGFSSSKDFDCTQTIGKLWCANGDVVFWFDGSSTATVSTAPLGDKINHFRNRVLEAGISGQKARLRMSGELDGTDWTTNTLSSSPVNIAVGGVDDGQGITCLMGAFQDVFLIGKLDSLWGLYGFDRRDFELREISREVGCLEQRSVQEKNNCLYWLSKRGIEKFCGAMIERVSDPIRDQIDTIIATAGNARSALDTTESDFEAGNLAASGPGARLSSTITPNSVVPSSWSITDTAFAGTFSSAAVISGSLQISTGAPFYNAGFEHGDLSNWTAVNFSTAGSLMWGDFSARAQSNFSSCVSAGNAGVQCRNNLDVYDAATNTLIYSTHSVALFKPITITAAMLNESTTAQIYVKAYDGNYSSYSLTSAAFTNWADGFTFLFDDTCHLGGNHGCILEFDMYEHADGVGFSSATFVSQTFDTSFSTPTWGLFSSTFTQSLAGGTSVYFQTQVSGDGSSWDGLAGDTDTVRLANAAKRYIRYKVTIQQSSSTLVGSIGTVGLLAETTGYFISQCRTPGSSITSWGLFTCNSVANGGVLSLAISTGTNCDSVTRATATWTAQANSSVISVATAAAVAYRVLFSIDAATQTPTLQDCTINWTEGATRPPVASSVYRDRYHLAYTSATNSTAVNDHELVLDKNDKWTLFDDHNCYSLALYNRKLYCGASTSSGQVWQQDVGTDDDGASYTSRIRTKAFNLGSPERRKDFKKVYIDLSPAPDASSVISLTGRYYLDRSTVPYSLGSLDLNEDPGTLQTGKFPFPLDQKTDGRYIQLELESSGKNQPWSLYGGRLYYTPLTPE
jgi:hypothetical protein